MLHLDSITKMTDGTGPNIPLFPLLEGKGHSVRDTVKIPWIYNSEIWGQIKKERVIFQKGMELNSFFFFIPFFFNQRYSWNNMMLQSHSEDPPSSPKEPGVKRTIN